MTALVSLVCCTLGRTSELDRLLKSLAGQCDNAQIIIVDQNEPDFLAGVLERHRSLPIQVERSARGLSRSRNVGIRAARGEIIGFPDDDCWYPEGTIDRVRELFDQHGDCAFVTGRTLDQTGVATVSPFLSKDDYITRSNVFHAGNEATLFVRTDVAKALLFDESLGIGAATPYQSGEGTDLLLRGLRAGFSGRFVRSLVVHHDQVSETELRVKRYSRGFGRVLRKNRFGAGYVAVRLCRSLAGAALRATTGDFAGARRRLLWAAGTATGYGARVLKHSVPRGLDAAD